MTLPRFAPWLDDPKPVIEPDEPRDLMAEAYAAWLVLAEEFHG